MIVLAVTRDREIGVDVECQVDGEDPLDVAYLDDRLFCPREARELRLFLLEQQADRFYELWTLKEAYVKSCGKGLFMPLDQFGFRFPCSHRVEIEFERVSSTMWTIRATGDSGCSRQGKRGAQSRCRNPSRRP